MPLPYLSKSDSAELIQLSRANLHLGQQTTKINMGEIMLVEHTLKVINV